MATQVRFDEALVNGISDSDIESAKALAISLNLHDLDPRTNDPSLQNKTNFSDIQTFSSKDDILSAVKDFFGQNKSLNLCEVGWDVFAVAAKAACAALTPAGAAIAMIIINRIYLKMRERCH